METSRSTNRSVRPRTGSIAEKLELRTFLSTTAWQSLADLPAGRFESEGAVVGTQLYVIGGFYDVPDLHAATRVDAFDTTSRTWTQMADIPEPVTHAGQAVDGNLIYVAGGFVGQHPGGSTDHVWVYNTATNAWSAGPSLPADRGGGGLAIVGRELHYFGGATRTAGKLDYNDKPDHWVLSLGPTSSTSDDATSWTTAAPITNPRNHIGGVGLGGKAYAIGGQHGGDEDDGDQNTVQSFDPNTGTWTDLSPLPRRLGHVTSSSFAMDGHIIVIGGVGLESAELDSVYSYDPAANKWSSLPSLPGRRQSPVAGAVNGAVYVTGGYHDGLHDDTWVATLGAHWTGAGDGLAAMPIALGEVAGGVIGDNLYLVGEGNPTTLVYDISDNAWTTAAPRPLVGDHHAAEVVGGKLYLVGGLDGGSEGAVQIYDPEANAWTRGASMPFAAGSSSSAVIGGKIYVAGGIVGSHTTNQTAVYDPQTNQWTNPATMPQGRNHAAAATDGEKLWVFGGRGAGSGDGNAVANGFNTVEVYDPATNAWTSSATAGSNLPPLPQARGGMGKAVFAGGEFYVMGGETLTGAGATTDDVYSRVDVYNPITRTWRLAPALPTARHGIFPLLADGRIYVAGGGVHSANSSSSVLQALILPGAGDPPTPEPEPTPSPSPSPSPTPTPTPTPPPATNPAAVLGRFIFYNNSLYDGNDPAAAPSDDAAIAPDKTALLSGQTATFANYTSFSRGINGVMIDLANAANTGSIDASDFTFHVGSNAATAEWTSGPTPSIAVRPGAGVGGSDRVTLIWPDSAIKKQWLQISINATAHTGLTSPDVFYFGNAIGEVGNSPTDAIVNGKDSKFTKRNHAATADLTSVYDFDRDGTIGVLDKRLAAKNKTNRKKALILITF